MGSADKNPWGDKNCESIDYTDGFCGFNSPPNAVNSSGKFSLSVTEEFARRERIQDAILDMAEHKNEYFHFTGPKQSLILGASAAAREAFYDKALKTQAFVEILRNGLDYNTFQEIIHDTMEKHFPDCEKYFETRAGNGKKQAASR